MVDGGMTVFRDTMPLALQMILHTLEGCSILLAPHDVLVRNDVRKDRNLQVGWNGLVVRSHFVGHAPVGGIGGVGGVLADRKKCSSLPLTGNH
jgi:hypothetical protein